MISSDRFRRGRGLAWLALIVAAAAIAVVVPGIATGKTTKPKPKPKPGKVVGHVYTENNGRFGNRVLIFNRYSDGSLKRVGNVGTGGNGGLQDQPGCTSPPLPPPGCPFLDTQNEVVLNKTATLLFVVNAGSNSITSFQVTKSGGLKRASIAPSGGEFPNSLTVHGSLLYVLNSGSKKAPGISGFVFTPKGKLVPIKGSTHPLVGGALPGASRQIGFDNSGTTLMVTLLFNKSGPPPAGGTKETIDTFPVNSHGQAGAGTPHDSTGKFAFAFAFDKQNQAIMAQLNSADPKTAPPPGTAQRYTAGGAPIGGEVKTVGFGPCWVVVTKNNRYAYIVNTSTGAASGATVAQYKIGPGGGLTRLVNSKARTEFALTDEALSADNRYLYVVSPLENGTGGPGGTSHIDTFAVKPNGRLTFVGETGPLPIPGLTGIAAT